jgi:hypothetical protein
VLAEAAVLDLGHEGQHDLADLGVRAAALDADLSGDRLAGHGVRRVQHGVDGRVGCQKSAAWL